tara:strand:- start:1008 stop:1493 length:486 start_codon:yes stop_codon:yes gene_type:complete
MSKTKNSYINKSKTNSWKTPKYVYDKLYKIFKFDKDFDPCPYNPNFQDGVDIDGRDIEWSDITYCNPPYSDLKSTKKKIGWIEKGHIEAQKGKTIIFLIPARTDTSWFHNIILKNNYRVKFIKGRVRFKNDDNDKSTSAPFPSMVIIMKKYKTKMNISIEF